jgi:hypothetical protein
LRGRQQGDQGNHAREVTAIALGGQLGFRGKLKKEPCGLHG